MSGNLHSDFARSERHDRIGAIRNFLDTSATLPEVQDYKQRIRTHLALQPGQTFLDVGCGMGHEVCHWAIDAPGVQVIGLDREAIIQEAAERATQLNVDVRWLVADAEAIPLPDRSVDACMTERVLKYLPEPDRALREIARVLKPGGRFASFEFDYDATVLGGPEDVGGQILEAMRESVNEPRMGRRLPDLLAEQSMVELSCRPVAFSPSWEIQNVIVGDTVRDAIASGKLPEEPAIAWLDEHSAAHKTGRFTVAFVGCLVTASMPS